MLAANGRTQADLYPVKASGHGMSSNGLEGSYEDHSMTMLNRVCGSCWTSASGSMGETDLTPAHMPYFGIVLPRCDVEGGYVSVSSSTLFLV